MTALEKIKDVIAPTIDKVTKLVSNNAAVFQIDDTVIKANEA